MVLIMSDPKDTKETKDTKNLSMKSLDKDLKQSNEETAIRFNTLEQTINGLADTVNDKLSEVLKAISAKNVPAIITKDGTHVEDVYLREDRVDIEFENNPDIHADVETLRPGLTSIDTMEFKEKADQTRFDQEKIQIMVMPSSSTYPDHTFFVGVNGVQLLIIRGTKQWLPRNYVEVLLRAKTSFYANIERRNAQNELEVIYPETKSHRYPLQILKDNNPLGVKWLNRVTNDTRC